MPTITAGEFLLTAEDYHRMAEVGILRPGDRLELIDGRIRPMSPIGAAHLFCVNRLNKLFAELTGDDVEVSVQNPVRLGPHQEPEPDLALLRRADAPRVPTTADALLVVEVADTTYAFDRHTKLPRYAAAGLPEVWIVNLPEGRVETYRTPTGGRYADEAVFAPGDTIPLPHTDERIPAVELLP